jgi:hypothetical protein
MAGKITERSFSADGFCKEYYKGLEGHVLAEETSKKKQAA